jgi:hypothetical protein
MRMKPWRLILVCCLVSVAACGDDPTSSGLPDGSDDTASDGIDDSAEGDLGGTDLVEDGDASEDATEDTGDGSGDAGEDAVEDSEGDTDDATDADDATDSDDTDASDAGGDAGDRDASEDEPDAEFFPEVGVDDPDLSGDEPDTTDATDERDLSDEPDAIDLGEDPDVVEVSDDPDAEPDETLVEDEPDMEEIDRSFEIRFGRFDSSTVELIVTSTLPMRAFQTTTAGARLEGAFFDIDFELAHSDVIGDFTISSTSALVAMTVINDSVLPPLDDEVFLILEHDNSSGFLCISLTTVFGDGDDVSHQAYLPEGACVTF